MLTIMMPNYNWIRSDMASLNKTFSIVRSSKIFHRSLNKLIYTLSGKVIGDYFDKLWNMPYLAILFL